MIFATFANSLATLTSYLQTHCNPHPNLTVLSSPLSGVGLFTTSDIPEDSVLLQIPLSSCTSASDAKASLPPILKDAPETLALAAYLYQNYVPSQNPYLDLCFESVSDHPLVTLRDDVLKNCDDPEIIREVNEIRAEADEAFKILSPHLTTTKIDPTRFKKSLAIILSRAFAHDDTERLVPGLDFLNHHHLPNINHSIYNGSIIVKASTHLPPTTELLNQYHQPSAPSYVYYSRYGFIPQN